MAIPSKYCISAFRARAAGSWTRACAHRHPNADDAHKCALKRGATIIVCDPEETGGKAAIAPAEHTKGGRAKAAVASAEAIAQGLEYFVLPRAGDVAMRLYGKLIGASTSQDPDSSKDRWTDVRIYRAARQDIYVVHVIGRSRLPGEVDDPRLHKASTAADVLEVLRHPKERYLTRVAMAALEDARRNDPAFDEVLVEDL